MKLHFKKIGKRIGIAILLITALIFILYLIETLELSLHKTTVIYSATNLERCSDGNQFEDWLTGEYRDALYPQCIYYNKKVYFPLEQVSSKFKYYNISFCSIYVKEIVLSEGWIGNEYVQNTKCDLRGAFIRLTSPIISENKISFRDSYYIWTPDWKKFRFNDTDVEFYEFRIVGENLELGLKIGYWEKLRPFSDFIANPTNIIVSTISKLLFG